MIRMSDIAQEAGVSRFTVSKVLNGDLTVKEQNRKQVLAVCARHGYSPNLHAVGLVRGRTDSIAMVVPYITDGFFNEIIEMLEHEATAKGYQLIYKSTYNDASIETTVIKNFLAMKVCAMIIVPAVGNTDLHLHRLAASQCPVIYLDHPLPGSVYLVANDNEQSGRTMTEYLLGRGVHPAYLDSFYRNDNIAAQDRRRGYEQAMKAHNLPPILIPNEFSTEKQDNEKFGYDNIAHFLKEHPAPQALFCVTDAAALGAMHAATEAGYSPGHNLLIAGHDNLRFGPYLQPALTTMRQPKETISHTCIELADKLIRQEKVARKKYIFPSELVIRQSS